MSTNQINPEQMQVIKELETSLNIRILKTDRVRFNKQGEVNILNLTNSKVKNEHLKSISSLIGLKWLELDKNQITEIKGLENLINLIYLDLSDNQIIETISLETLKNLKTLILSNNQIKNYKRQYRQNCRVYL